MIQPLLTSDILILSSKGKFPAYFAVQRAAQGLFESESHLHQIFSPIVEFLCSGSLSPMPPAFLGRKAFSHLSRAHFRFGPELPQRKLRCSCLMALRTHFGAARMEIMGKGYILLSEGRQNNGGY